jgi:hypothetical protein
VEVCRLLARLPGKSYKGAKQVSCCKDGVCNKSKFCQSKRVLDDDDEPIKPVGQPSPWAAFVLDCLYVVFAFWIVAFSIGVVSGVMERI